MITFASRNIHAEERGVQPRVIKVGADDALSQEAWKLVERLSSEGNGEEERIAFCVSDGG